eukprot:TRINITY_DN347_c0_g1_i3.p1 TRINITY_DN347_c0_g1~~TRINITY_DN347_c0_g1_i3.p1  ORF type:complete len:1789 (+),score=315.35 TRINITY_DN347_c0_g1_i3:411-5369(+)
MQEVNEAWRIFCDPDLRQAYDEYFARHGSADASSSLAAMRSMLQHGEEAASVVLGEKMQHWRKEGEARVKHEQQKGGSSSSKVFLECFRGEVAKWAQRLRGIADAAPTVLPPPVVAPKKEDTSAALDALLADARKEGLTAVLAALAIPMEPIRAVESFVDANLQLLCDILDAACVPSLPPRTSSETFTTTPAQPASTSSVPASDVSSAQQRLVAVTPLKGLRPPRSTALDASSIEAAKREVPLAMCNGSQSALSPATLQFLSRFWPAGLPPFVPPQQYLQPSPNMSPQTLGHCEACHTAFDPSTWKCNCPACGRLLCSKCLPHSRTLHRLRLASQQRICTHCWTRERQNDGALWVEHSVNVDQLRVVYTIFPCHPCCADIRHISKLQDPMPQVYTLLRLRHMTPAVVYGQICKNRHRFADSFNLVHDELAAGNAIFKSKEWRKALLKQAKCSDLSERLHILQAESADFHCFMDVIQCAPLSKSVATASVVLRFLVQLVGAKKVLSCVLDRANTPAFLLLELLRILHGASEEVWVVVGCRIPESELPLWLTALREHPQLSLLRCIVCAVRVGYIELVHWLCNQTALELTESNCEDIVAGLLLNAPEWWAVAHNIVTLRQTVGNSTPPPPTDGLLQRSVDTNNYYPLFAACVKAGGLKPLILLCAKQRLWPEVAGLMRTLPKEMRCRAYHMLCDSFVSAPRRRAVTLALACREDESYLAELGDEFVRRFPAVALHLYTLSAGSTQSSKGSFDKMAQCFESTGFLSLALESASRVGSDSVPVLKKKLEDEQVKQFQHKVAACRLWQNRLPTAERFAAIMAAHATGNREQLLVYESALPGQRWQRRNVDGVCELLCLGGIALIDDNVIGAMRCAAVAARMLPSEDAVSAVAQFLSHPILQRKASQLLVRSMFQLSRGELQGCPLFLPDCDLSAGSFSASVVPLPHVFQQWIKSDTRHKACLQAERAIINEVQSTQNYLAAAMSYLDLATALDSLPPKLGCLLGSLRFFVHELRTADNVGDENALWRAAMDVGRTALLLASQMLAPPVTLNCARHCVSLLLRGYGFLKFSSKAAALPEDGEFIATMLGLAVKNACGTEATWAVEDGLAMDAGFSVYTHLRLHSKLLLSLYERGVPDSVLSRAVIAYNILHGELRRWYMDPTDISDVEPVPEQQQTPHDPLGCKKFRFEIDKVLDAIQVRLARAKMEEQEQEYGDAVRSAHAALALLRDLDGEEDQEEGLESGVPERAKLELSARLIACSCCFKLRCWRLLDSNARVLSKLNNPDGQLYQAVSRLWLSDDVAHCNAALQFLKPTGREILQTQIELWRAQQPLNAMHRSGLESWRGRCILELLQQSKLTWTTIRNNVAWGGEPRAPGGWFQDKRASLQGMEFGALRGFSLDMSKGSLEFKIDYRSEKLLRSSDLATVFRSGATSAMFSLEPLEAPDEMPFHPFHAAKVSPGSLDGDVLATLLHTDWLLKFLSLGVEVSVEPPFAIRPVEQGLLHRLPERLRHVVRCVHAREAKYRGSALRTNYHRFWIEACELQFTKTESNGTLEVVFGRQAMQVRSHKMFIHEGKLQDTTDEEDDDAEADFAADLTRHYDELAQYFPALERLRELSKAGHAGSVSQDVHPRRQASGHHGRRGRRRGGRLRGRPHPPLR